MKIIDVASRLYHIPPTVSWEDATHRVASLEFIITRVTTDAGIVGEGFAYTTGIGGSAILALIDDYCQTMLVGQDPRQIERLWSFLYGQLHRSGTGGINSLALGAIDIALWDITAKWYNVPLHRVLGARRDSVATYGSGIDLFLDSDALLSQVDGFLAQGHKAVKVKIGRENPEEDIDRITAVKKLIGSRRRLFVDANQRWNVADCMCRLQKLAPFELGWIEEPLHAEDIRGHADLRQFVSLPVAVGESLYTRHQFADYLQANAVDVVQADVCRVGGISEWLKIANLSASFHRTMAPHYMSELSVALMCAIDNAEILECVHGGSFSEMGVLQTELRLENGVAFPFETPGHGVRFDDEKLERFAVDPASLRTRNMQSAK
ncbi:MAG: mandelate racemase/muconate lactonizing enzyme family protein [Mesorhizobium sp.]|uniref:mandelate racemase/muconate lactonizing enzyme family protein n=1 Tax=Mesorhizobium sp. TaxID=1871066 RepID=UPI000FE885FF|nr:mandelate racemase/muconate lactonizing enzyme family protein [Mesorhizobium sp.]RWB95801.1 MAG: mandelate racemase/muconate lactonizing enzyme family protein [Mesorhizobium sp.]RWE17435.1 MAG: mandelate racemase/muconate lactonizing enzyme family protein [Mesorhizobium sp.]TIS45426.1 MAG: mandelate racemase/muconate lactonizing enzyme family protein [Mesorhizobium sp.]